MIDLLLIATIAFACGFCLATWGALARHDQQPAVSEGMLLEDEEILNYDFSWPTPTSEDLTKFRHRAINEYKEKVTEQISQEIAAEDKRDNIGGFVIEEVPIDIWSKLLPEGDWKVVSMTHPDYLPSSGPTPTSEEPTKYRRAVVIEHEG